VSIPKLRLSRRPRRQPEAGARDGHDHHQGGERAAGHRRTRSRDGADAALKRPARRRAAARLIGHLHSTMSKSLLAVPHSGQTQSSGCRPTACRRQAFVRRSSRLVVNVAAGPALPDLVGSALIWMLRVGRKAHLRRRARASRLGAIEPRNGRRPRPGSNSPRAEITSSGGFPLDPALGLPR